MWVLHSNFIFWKCKPRKFRSLRSGFVSFHMTNEKFIQNALHITSKNFEKHSFVHVFQYPGKARSILVNPWALEIIIRRSVSLKVKVVDTWHFRES